MIHLIYLFLQGSEETSGQILMVHRCNTRWIFALRYFQVRFSVSMLSFSGYSTLEEITKEAIFFLFCQSSCCDFHFCIDAVVHLYALYGSRFFIHVFMPMIKVSNKRLINSTLEIKKHAVQFSSSGSIYFFIWSNTGWNSLLDFKKKKIKLYLTRTAVGRGLEVLK